MVRRSLRFGAALLLGLAPLAPSPALAQRLSPQEARIAAYVDAHAGEAVELMRRLAEINSGTMNHEGVREVGRVMEAELAGLGFDTRWVPMPDSVNRAGHLFAEREGTRGQTVLLLGHLDTVFDEADPFQRFTRNGDTARGPGLADMKGGDAVIVFALRALHSVGALDGSRIIVALTGDAERPGRPLNVSRRDLIEAAIRSDVALDFEGGVREQGKEYATIALRSASGWTLRVRGAPAHSASIFTSAVGNGAILEAARILDAWRQELRKQDHVSLNPGVMLGGNEASYDDELGRGTAAGKASVVASTVVVEGDLRTRSDEQLDQARAAMRRIAAQSAPGTRAELAFVDGYPAMSPSDGNRALLGRLSQVSRDLGLPAVEALNPDLRGAADISFVAPFVDALGGLGVHGSGAHTAAEAVDLASLPAVIKRAAILLYRLTR